MLRRLTLIGVVCGCALVLAPPGVAQQQENSAPAQQGQPASGANQKKDQQKKPKSTADANPFPEAQSQAAAQQSQQQDQNAAPSAPAPQNQSNSTAQRNPFPEKQSEKAAQDNQENGGGAPPGSKGDFSSSQVKGMDLPDANAPTTVNPAPLLHNPTLAKKDVQVGTFYLQSGNPKGAYDRFAEATQYDPGNAEAVYGLAASAEKIGKRDEALRNYRLYLSALPDGPHAKEARKAMKHLGAEPAA